MARRSRTVVAVLSTGGFLFAVSQTLVLPLLGVMASGLGTDFAVLSWLVTGPLIVAAAFSPVLGRCADLYGSRVVLLLTLGALVCGAVICGFAPSPGALIVGRCVQGLGGAYLPVAIAALRSVLPPGRFPRNVAMLSSSQGVGVAFGVGIGGLLAEIVPWRAVFLSYSIAGALVFALVVYAVDPTPARRLEKRSFDAPGALALALALAILMTSITTLTSRRFDGWTVVAAMAALACFAVWFLIERRSAAPLVDLRAFLRPANLMAAAISLCVGYAMFANMVVSTQASHVLLGAGPGVTGAFVAPAGIAVVIFAQLSASLTGRHGPVSTLITAGAVVTVGFLVHLFAAGSWWTLAGLLLAAAGTSLAYSALPVVVTEAAPVGDRASANAANALVRTVGQALAGAVSAAILGGATAHDVHLFVVAFAIAMGSGVLIVLGAIALGRR